MIGSLFVSTFLLALITSIVFTISPLIIVHNMGISIAIFSLIEGFCEFVANIMKLTSGLLIDRWKKQKSFLLLGIFLATLSKPFLFLNSGFSILFSKVLERLSNGLTATPRDVIVTECSSHTKKGRNYGLVMTGKMLGCTIGPLFVAATLSAGWFDHTYLAFLWMMVGFGCLSFWVTWKYVPAVHAASKEHIFQWKHAFSFNQSYWVIILIASLFMLGRFQDGMLLLHLKASGYPEWLYISTSGVFNGISAMTAWGVGKTLDSRWRFWIYILVPLALILSDLCFAWGGSMTVPILGMCLWGFQRSASQILFVSEIARIAPPEFLGTAIGIYYIATGICSFIAGAYAGILVDIQPELFFGVSSFFGLLALLAFGATRHLRA